jgi:hypothetical protein
MSDDGSLGLFLQGYRPSGVLNVAPTDIALTASTIAENSAQGTVVGVLSVTDPDAGDTVTFTLTNNAGNRFQIVGTSLQAGSVATNYEGATSHQITVRATDAGGLTYDENFTITVTDVDDTAPTFTTGTTGSVAENATLSFTVTTNESTTKTIVGGADSSKFEFVSGGSGNVSHTLRFASNGTKDFETPDDADANNTYVVTVRATDAANNTADQTITITVTDESESLTWQDTYTAPAANDNSAGWNGYNIRQWFAASALAVSGSAVRLTLIAGPSEGTQISAMYIGHAASSGDAYDFDGTQVPVTVSGSGSFTVGVSSTVVTDEVEYAIDETKALIVAFHCNSAAADILRGATSATGAAVYYKSAASEVSVSNVSTYTQLGASGVRLISKIEAGS